MYELVCEIQKKVLVAVSEYVAKRVVLCVQYHISITTLFELDISRLEISNSSKHQEIIMNTIIA